MKGNETIKDVWEDLVIKIQLKPDTLQYREMRKAFYCGASFGILANKHIAETQMDDDLAVEWLNGHWNEVCEFREEIIREVYDGSQ